MRTFIAIELPQVIKDSLSEIQSKLRSTLPKIGWVKQENLHLTLKFLAETSPKQVDSLKQIITEVAETTADFKLKLKILGAFPDIRAARIIWIGANQLPVQLKELVEQIETKIARLGKPKEKRLFRSHITIGRIRNNIDPSLLEKEISKINDEIYKQNLEFNAKAITLFESILGKAGPTYNSLAEENFKIN